MESAFSPKQEADADKTGRISFSAEDLKDISLPNSSSSGSTPITRSEILDFKDQAFLLKNVLLKNECQHFIDEGERLAFENIPGAKDSYRCMKRITLNSPDLANMLWQRIRPWLKDITVGDDLRALHVHGIKFLMKGTWTPIGLNPVFRLCRYRAGGHFAPHFDGYFVENSRERSLQTFMLYLNGDFEGGSTNFVDENQTLHMDGDGKYCAEEKNVLCRVQPEDGLAIIFNHQRLHEGQKIRDGVKYILRTDITFRNTSQNNWSENDEKALQLAQEAERKEADGDCMAAAELYRRAFKLSDEVAQAYGSC